MRFSETKQGRIFIIKLEGDTALTQLIQQVVSAPIEFSSDSELLYHVREEIASRIEQITDRR